MFLPGVPMTKRLSNENIPVSDQDNNFLTNESNVLGARWLPFVSLETFGTRSCTSLLDQVPSFAALPLLPETMEVPPSMSS